MTKQLVAYFLGPLGAFSHSISLIAAHRHLHCNLHLISGVGDKMKAARTNWQAFLTKVTQVITFLAFHKGNKITRTAAVAEKKPIYRSRCVHLCGFNLFARWHQRSWFKRWGVLGDIVVVRD